MMKSSIMRVPVIVPDLQADTEVIQVSGWLVDSGDYVVAGESIAELLIPGVTFDVAAESTGRLVEIVASVDTVVRTGDVLGWVETATDDEEYEEKPA
jgi:pyruvate/2-oxoglutarate dehydrogenase complex dihydrolipoamide acyltransferase (E2) component